MTGLSGVFIKNIFQKAGVLDSGQKAIELYIHIHTNLTNVALLSFVL